MKAADRLVVVQVDGDRIVCRGRFKTADGKRYHSALNPVLHLNNIQAQGPIKAGDAIQRYADHPPVHFPSASVKK